MAIAALVLYVTWATIAFGARTLIQVRRTGDSGFRGSGSRPGSAQWWARALFVGALATGLAAPLAALTGVAEPIPGIDATGIVLAGALIAVVGIFGTLWAQLAMGDSWRIGVDEDEHTELVRTGPFRIVRNPIFTTMALTAFGLAAMVPSAVALAGLGALVVALQLQVRVGEEPYLLATHGDSYARYAARTGRFVPALGRRSGDERHEPGSAARHEHGHHDHHEHDHEHEHPSGLRAAIWSVIQPHSHDTTGRVDDTSEVGIRALKISLIGLGITALVQAVIVAASGSVALLADTVHNFADALTAVPLWLAFVIGRRPPTRRYTYGYGRAEDLAGVFIVAVIAVSAGVAGYQAIQRLLDPQGVTNLRWVGAAGVAGFLGNELAAIYRIRVGRRIGSAALVADGLHARTDGLTSLGVVIGAIGVTLGFERADPIVGLAITVIILGVLRGAVRDIYHRLMDSVDPALVERIEHTLHHIPGVEAVDSVRVRWIGRHLHAEAEIVSHPDLSLTSAHHIAETARHELLHIEPKLRQAIIHTSPRDEDGHNHHALVAHHPTLPVPTP